MSNNDDIARAAMDQVVADATDYSTSDSVMVSITDNEYLCGPGMLGYHFSWIPALDHQMRIYFSAGADSRHLSSKRLGGVLGFLVQ